MEVCVVGTGYVGLVTGAVFADLGNDVVCVDKDKKKIDMLKKGEMPIYEPGLEEMVNRNAQDGRLRFTTDMSEGVQRSKVIFIAVGTPPKTSGETDLSQVESVAKDIAKYIDEYKVIVNKSTVPVGTGDLVRQIIQTNKRRNVDFDVVSNPEFLKEGSAINDTLFPERIVIGAPDRHVAMILLELYAPLERPMLITDVYSAEVIKYASNAFLATKISFINSISNICEAAGANVTHVVRGMGFDQRIGSAFLQPGLGYGGSCFPKDSESLVYTAERLGCDFGILREVIKENRLRVSHFMDRMRKVMGSFKGKTVGLFGLAFKPNTDDLREAKSLEIIKILHDEGAAIRAYDPIAMDNCKTFFPQVTYCPSSFTCAEGCDALVIITEWNEFKLINLDKIKSLVKAPLIFDGRNIYDPDRLRRLGFEYHSVGR